MKNQNIQQRPKNLQELINLSFLVTPGMSSYTPFTFKRKVIETVVSEETNHKYAYNNNIWAFVFNDNEYVVPYFKGIRRILEESRFQHSHFEIIPFSNSDQPLQDAQKWSNLLTTTKEWNIEDARKKCIEYSSLCHILPLPKKILDRAFEIPFQGIMLTGTNGHHFMEFPNLQSELTSQETINRLGTFDCDNEVYLINANDGRSYTVKDFPGLEELLFKNGYRELPLRVPFANGETVCCNL